MPNTPLSSQVIELNIQVEDPNAASNLGLLSPSFRRKKSNLEADGLVSVSPNKEVEKPSSIFPGNFREFSESLRRCHRGEKAEELS